MTIDFIPNINDFNEHVVRLYGFDKVESERFRKALHQVILVEKQPLDLLSLLFVEPRNANLILRISEEDEGISTEDNKVYYCDLTLESYKKMEKLIQPFSTKDTVTFQWLYDVDTEIDLLYAPAGIWEEEEEEVKRDEVKKEL